MNIDTQDLLKVIDSNLKGWKNSQRSAVRRKEVLNKHFCKGAQVALLDLALTITQFEKVENEKLKKLAHH